jgi:hypothetical protein
MSGLSMPIGAEDREEARSLGRLRQRLVHLEGQVRALDAGVDDHGVSEPERVDDVVQHVGGGGRSEREDRRPPEPLRGVAETEVGRAEVVAPLRHAVRLVDDEQRGAAGGQRVEELRVLQALGVTYTSSGLPARTSSTASRSSDALSVESSLAASMRACSSLSCWSCMRAISGDTTTTGFENRSAGSW